MNQPPETEDAPAAIDAKAVAERVLKNPRRNALQVSTLEMTAVAERLIALEQLALTAFRMLHGIDRYCASPKPEKRALAALADTLIQQTADALHALGFKEEEVHDESKNQEQDAGPASTGSAG
jgi:hypothetical protein